MGAVKFFVPGEPKPQPRVRPTSDRRGVWMPPKARGWRELVAIHAHKAWRFKPIVGPVEMSIRFVMGRPNSHLTKAGALRSTSPMHHTYKPDADNLAKSTKDALNGVLYRDDAQVVRLDLAKVWADIGEASGAHISLEPVL